MALVSSLLSAYVASGVSCPQNRLTREQAEKGVADMTEHLERMVAQSTPESGGDGEEL